MASETSNSDQLNSIGVVPLKLLRHGSLGGGARW